MFIAAPVVAGSWAWCRRESRSTPVYVLAVDAEKGKAVVKPRGHRDTEVVETRYLKPWKARNNVENRVGGGRPTGQPVTPLIAGSKDDAAKSV